MAKGKATPGSFVAGDPRAVAAGRKSSRALPPDLKEAREVRRIEFEQIIYKYLDKSPAEIKTLLLQKDQLPMKELIVLKLVHQAMEQGDLPRLNFLLDRTVGKIPDKLEVDRAGSFEKLHDAIMNDLEKADKT